MKKNLNKQFLMIKLIILILTVILLFLPIHFFEYLDESMQPFLMDASIFVPDSWIIFLYIFLGGVVLNLIGIKKNVRHWDFIIALGGFLIYLILIILTLMDGWMNGFGFYPGFYILISILVIILIEKIKISKETQIADSKTMREEIRAQEQPFLRETEHKEIQEGKREFIEAIDYRTKTNANFPERWAMKYGKKPSEKENFQYFQEFEGKISSEVMDPNYFHLKLVHLLEDLDYRIEINTPPISETQHDVRYYDINGEIVGTIKKAKKKSGKKQSFTKPIIGAIFLVISAILLFLFILNIIPGLLFAFTSITISIVLIPIGFYLIILFVIKLFKNPSLKNYTKIFLIERGTAYSGIKKTAENNPNNSFSYPVINSNMKISLAGAADSMDKEKLKKDLKTISEMIQETVK
ncbi:MAG: hypothetical protein ACTSP9_08235 [Promethearchaeota archaeon]